MKPEKVKFMLMVQDMERGVSFYRDILGFTEGFVSPDWSELRFGDAIVALHGGGDGLRQETGLSIQYEDLDYAFQNAVKGGATPVQAPASRDGEPVRLGSIADPEGNVIMLTQYLG